MRFVGRLLLFLPALLACDRHADDRYDGAGVSRPHVELPQPPRPLVVDTAVIVDAAEAATIEVPASVRSGESFHARVTVLGGGCRRAIAPPDVVVLADTAEIIPLVYRSTATSCPLDRIRLTTEAELRFDVPGTAIVRVLGRRVGPPSPFDVRSSGEASLARIERRIAVLGAHP